ncbi:MULTISPECIES: amino acid carrier protein [unclassified Neochlamydia]|uniref:alanine/glycine:cation symporter family protein n=1 Tax=unclassified Neochlamydia TaxID=2643326 RepID=UPI001F61122B|nr:MULTISPECIES: amino acid carrier protein [unclassified Neochlamydia]
MPSLERTNQIFTLYVVFPFIILLGLYFTIKLRGFQIARLKNSFGYLLKQQKNAQGNISYFEAISTVLAGNFGTGNISGMAIALSTGGPGALIWMWIIAFFGSAIQYSSCILGVKYRQKDEGGEYVSGPMYYLSKGLGLNSLAKIFCVFTLFAALAVGNFAQINSMTLPIQKMGFPPLLCGFIFAFFIGLVLLGGIQRIARFASIIVPLKAFLYLTFTLIILYLNREKVWPALQLMFTSAFNFQAAAGGIIGISTLKAITTGFNRAIFATDAGTGIVPILQASARTEHPVIDGLVSLVAPCMVLIVCTMTGLVLLTTGAWQHGDLQSTNMVTYAFRIGLGHQIGEYVVIIALIMFGFTTILAWAYCATQAITYLGGHRFARPFTYLYILLIPLGTLIQINLVWDLADLCITCMLVVNLIGIAGLANEVIIDSRAYFKDDKLKAKKNAIGKESA